MQCPMCSGSGAITGSTGALLRSLRQARRLSLRDVAAQLPSVPVATLSRIETGSTGGVPFETIVALADFYGVPIADLRPR